MAPGVRLFTDVLDVLLQDISIQVEYKTQHVEYSTQQVNIRQLLVRSAQLRCDRLVLARLKQLIK